VICASARKRVIACLCVAAAGRITAAEALGQVMAQNLAAGLQGSHAAPAPAQPVGVAAEDVMATLEKLGELKAKGILTQEEFDAKKAELLKKLV